MSIILGYITLQKTHSRRINVITEKLCVVQFIAAALIVNVIQDRYIEGGNSIPLTYL